MFRVILWDVDATLLNFEKAEEAGIRGCFEKYNLGECTDKMLENYKLINRGYWQAECNNDCGSCAANCN